MIEKLSQALAGRYVIERELGAGGMATVYLAHDERHDRMVALKVLRPELAAVIGADRFLTEIRTTANLQHPRILPLHDSGEVEGTVFYVMPFVDGESLRDRLDREKQLPVADAIRIGTEVASALDYAHRQGVVHRDIKPENILLHDGQALVADFGIALAAAETGGARLTETGMSLGTPHYMSPEQATGERELDGRADIYALGCVVYEALVGEPPFTGATAQAIVGKVLMDDPEPILRSRRSVPQHVDDAVLIALEKLPADRFATAAEFASALSGEAPTTRLARRVVGGRRQTGLFWPVALAGVGALAIAGWLRAVPSPAESPPSRLAIVLPSLGGSGTGLLRQLALLPDGSGLIYTAIAPDGENRTMRIDLDETDPEVVPGVVPFLSSYSMSPDGREFIGMTPDSRSVYRHALAGSRSQLLPELPSHVFVAWGRDGQIWLSSAYHRGISKLVGDQVTQPFGDRHVGFLLNQMLPDGHTALAVYAPAGIAYGPVHVIDLETGEATLLIEFDVVEVRYAAGHVVYALPDGTLNARPFDAGRLRLTGPPVQIADDVYVPGSAVANFSVATNGTVAYIPEEPRQLVLVGRDGSRRLATNQNQNFHAPTFSPDGRTLAVDFNSADGRDVWTIDLDTRLVARATFERDGHDPMWSLDGRSLTYLSFFDGTLALLRTRPGQTTPPDTLVADGRVSWSGDWLPDGNTLVTTALGLSGGLESDIALVRLGAQPSLEPLITSRFADHSPAVSPDGRWLAYSSTQSGSFEVYVRPLDSEGPQVQISNGGGIEPVWAPDGAELFYRSGAGEDSELIAATIVTEPALRVTGREALFSVVDIATATPHANYDVSPDGQTFAMVAFNPVTRIMVIQNLPGLVRKLTGGNGEP